jgi:class 3 adenylate cyclase
MERRTGYVNLDTARIAYQVAGTGPVDLVFVLGSFVSFDTADEDAMADVYYRRLASFTRLIRFDRRGAGSSDTVSLDDASDLESYVEETLAVMDAVGTERAAVMAGYDAGPMAMKLAVMHPDRVTAVILSNTTARYLKAEDYPIGLDADRAQQMVAMVSDTWGAEEQISNFIPSRANDPTFRARMARMQRLTLSPTEAATYMRAMVDMDVRSLLASIQVPTLILHRSGFELIPLAHAQYLADHIMNAQLVAIPGKDGPFVWEHPEVALDAIEEFLTGVAPEAGTGRVITTVLFTDIVGSTRRAEELGDRRWRALLDVHDELASRVVAAHAGTLVKMTGDGFMATFDRPGTAILAAAEFGRQVEEVGVEIRMGVHTGEVEVRGDDVGGLAVHLASRVMDMAQPGEILVSRTVKDLVVGADLSFEDRGFHTLKGFESEWQLYSVARPTERTTDTE